LTAIPVDELGYLGGHGLVSSHGHVAGRGTGGVFSRLGGISGLGISDLDFGGLGFTGINRDGCFGGLRCGELRGFSWLRCGELGLGGLGRTVAAQLTRVLRVSFAELATMGAVAIGTAMVVRTAVAVGAAFAELARVTGVVTVGVAELAGVG
jgi:hypothetical protein